MSIDQGAIGSVAARLMESLEEEYGEHAELRSAMLIVEISYVNPDDVDDHGVTVRWEDTGFSPVSKVGLLVSTLRGLLA